MDPVPTQKKISAAKKQLVKIGKTATLFRIPGEGNPGEWRQILAEFSPRVAKYLRSLYPNVIIANEDFSLAAESGYQEIDNRFSSN